MIPVTQTASAKIILLGEHAVVYNQPAIAVPVCGLRTTASLQPFPDPSRYILAAQDLAVSYDSGQAYCPPSLAPFTCLIALLAEQYSIPRGGWELTISSQVPIARGLGSGAAASVAIIRAFNQAFSLGLTIAAVSALAYEIEKIHHGNPSGIDNTVIAYEQPIVYQRNLPIEVLTTKEFYFVVADSGIVQSTRSVVEDVAQARARNSDYYDGLFAQIGKLTGLAREKLRAGDSVRLGALLTANHELLKRLGVSHPSLDLLVAEAQHAGALGAKLCGSGRGGCMIGLAASPTALQPISDALRSAGAAFVATTKLNGSATTGEHCSNSDNMS